jgi:hypothetical protein
MRSRLLVEVVVGGTEVDDPSVVVAAGGAWGVKGCVVGSCCLDVEGGMPG